MDEAINCREKRRRGPDLIQVKSILFLTSEFRLVLCDAEIFTKVISSTT